MGYFCWWHGVISLPGAYKAREKVSNSHTRLFYEHNLAVAGTALCTMANISARAVFFNQRVLTVKFDSQQTEDFTGAVG